MADVHLQDIYGEFTDTDYRGVLNPKTGRHNTIRTMEAQLKSTRLFNENYFAFLAALDDVVKRNIKLVVLPGDFSDDGQPLNIRALRKILDQYSKQHGITFLATTGNHDPVRPFTKEAGKKDFLGIKGMPQAIISKAGLYELGADQLSPIISTDIKNWGYAEILQELRAFGFFPQEDFLYWETPFSKYNDTYSFEAAQEASLLENRKYANGEAGLLVPDVSYLIEPVEDVWLLALDANVYLPKDRLSGINGNPDDFGGASVGYNNVLTHKKYLISWAKNVSQRAKKQGKTLIAFSHYPMVDFNDDASGMMENLLGEGKMQLQRVPREEVATAFADAGIQIHVGGHVHINDTGIRTTENGNTLFNIQVPSLAAYMPGYKILTIHSEKEIEVETVVMDEVMGFDELFPLYQMEWDYLKQIWKRDILKVNNYGEFTEWHLKELVRMRFIPQDWNSDFAKALLHSTGKELLLRGRKDSQKSMAQELPGDSLNLKSFEEWTGFDMLIDFYRLRNADELALKDIDENRMDQYIRLATHMSGIEDVSFNTWGQLFLKTLQGQPADHFRIALDAGTIERLSPIQ
ncbi:MAG: metallophosphoesterase [Cyclobacteriaceae bacterium]